MGSPSVTLLLLQIERGIRTDRGHLYKAGGVKEECLGYVQTLKKMIFYTYASIADIMPITSGFEESSIRKFVSEWCTAAIYILL